jgi:hypothetical protein
MLYSERSYAFMVTKAALEAAGIPHDQMLQILAGITRKAPLVSVLQSKFIDFAKNAIRKAGNFKVLSYHGRKGRIINNAETPEGNLRPTENATNPDRRPADLMYAKLSCDLFSSQSTQRTHPPIPLPSLCDWPRNVGLFKTRKGST